MHFRSLLCAVMVSFVIITPAAATDTATSDDSFPTDQHEVTRVIEHGLSLIGAPYRRGGTSESGFDCSGFVQRVFSDALGVTLPRTARDMAQEGERIKAKDALQPGDLVFFNTMRKAFSHVGIYLGNNRFLHSPSRGGSVSISDMTEKYWAKRYNGARRLLSDD